MVLHLDFELPERSVGWWIVRQSIFLSALALVVLAIAAVLRATPTPAWEIGPLRDGERDSPERSHK